jgi:hypothetical protein
MSDASPATAGSGGGNPRQTILLLVLGLLAVALVYDYKVARPSVDAAYDKIAEKSMDVNSKSTETLTNVGVRELLVMEPSDSFEEANGDMVEVFSWRSGLPIRTHNLYAVYKKNGDDWLFHRHSKFLHESSTDVSQHDVKGGTIIMSAEGDEEGEMSEAEGQGGGSSDGGDGQGGGGAPEGRGPGPAAGGGGDPFAGSSAFDPEARARSQPEQVFAENDEDGDGKLTEFEIPQISNQTRVKMDKDSDGVLTKEEWMAEFAPAAEPASTEDATAEENEPQDKEAAAEASEPVADESSDD